MPSEFNVKSYRKWIRKLHEPPAGSRNLFYLFSLRWRREQDSPGAGGPGGDGGDAAQRRRHHRRRRELIGRVAAATAPLRPVINNADWVSSPVWYAIIYVSICHLAKILLIRSILPLLKPTTLIEIMYIYLQSKQHSPTNMRYHNNALVIFNSVLTPLNLSGFSCKT